MLPFHGFGRTIYPPEPTRQPLALRRIRYFADNALGLARPSGLNASIAPGRPGASGGVRGIPGRRSPYRRSREVFRVARDYRNDAPPVLVQSLA